MRLVLILLCVLGAMPARAELVDRVVARVGPRILLQSDIRLARALGLAGAGRAEDDLTVLRRLVDRALALGDVERARPSGPDEAAVAAARAALVQRAGGLAPAVEAARLAGLPADAIDRLAREDAALAMYVRQRFGEDPASTAREAWTGDLRRRSAVICVIGGC